ncbi:hypothetical protein [Methylocaldum szegediense]|uniref:hypothetical protein n=1 Tax=Methylocaldum szegediense TaxID=73780 RepID=UPI0003F92788|nr:hypothetical protein [Methylocaldum szegediense]
MGVTPYTDVDRLLRSGVQAGKKCAERHCRRRERIYQLAQIIEAVEFKDRVLEDVENGTA